MHRPSSRPIPQPPAAPAGPHPWGAGEVRARLKEAAAVLRALALTGRDRPAKLAAHWPEVVRDGFEASAAAPMRNRPPAPRPAAVTRADAAVAWLYWTEAAERRVLWARALGVPWRRLEDMDGRSHTTLRKVEAAGCEAICRRLNAALVPEDAVAAAFRQGRAGRGGGDGSGGHRTGGKRT